MPRVVKSLAFFDHLAAQSQDECERHYMSVHVPFILRSRANRGRALRSLLPESPDQPSPGVGR